MDNFEKENKRLKVLIVILLLVLLGFGGFYYYMTYVKGDDKTAIDNEIEEKEEGNKVEEQSSEISINQDTTRKDNIINITPYDVKEFLNMVKGKWTYCSGYDSNNQCQGGIVIYFKEDTVDIYYINSEGLVHDGKLLSVGKIKDNMYNVIGIMENASDHVNYDYDNKNIVFSFVITVKDSSIFLNEYNNLSLLFHDRELGSTELKLEK